MNPEREPVQAPAQAYDLTESIELTESGVNADGTVNMHLIRPCVGKGKGKHLYEAEMLERNAGVFKGWKMFIDHLSPDAKRKAQGLPRSIRDLGGRIEESWWDPNVPADPEKGYAAGSVVGRSRPVGIARALIEEDPSIVEASIHANATGVKQVTRDGQKVWLVEGIEKKGSVDWVSEAGAGGRVVPLMEAVYDDTTADEIELDSLSDDEFLAHVRQARPHLIEALAETDGQAEVTEPQGGEMPISPEELREALTQDESLVDVLKELVEGQVTAQVDERIAVERDFIRAEALAETARNEELRDLKETAHRLITEAKLPEAFADQLKDEYDIANGRPSLKLAAATDEVDDEGNTLKSATDVLREAVEADITKQRTLLATVMPTRVRGQGPSKPAGDGEAATEVEEGKAYWEEFLEESGVKEPAKAYELTG